MRFFFFRGNKLEFFRGNKLERSDKNCTGVITRCVAPFLLGLRRRYATRPSARIDRRSKPHFGRAP